MPAFYPPLSFFMLAVRKPTTPCKPHFVNLKATPWTSNTGCHKDLAIDFLIGQEENRGMAIIAPVPTTVPVMMRVLMANFT